MADLWSDIKELGGAVLIAILALSFATLLCGFAYNIITRAG